MKKIVVVIIVMMMFSAVRCSAFDAGEYSLTNSEREVICRFVLAEGDDVPFAVKVAICNVVLNRLQNELYPNDVISIIYNEGEFPSAYDGRMEAAYSEKAVLSARRALSCAEGGLDVSGGALKFAVGDVSDFDEITLLIGNFAFGI